GGVPPDQPPRGAYDARRARPVRALAWSAGARPPSAETAIGRPSRHSDPWIEIRIQNVDDEIGKDKNCGQQQYAGLDQRQVLGLDCLDGQTSHTRPRENSLGNHGAPKQGSELESDDGDERNQSVAQRMFDNNSADAEALGMRGANIVTSEYFQHAATPPT